MKRFLYLFQVAQDLPSALEAAAGPHSDILYLSWREKSADPRSIFYPSSSWTQGRNRLLKEALGRDYGYFVFADDDVHLELTTLGARAAGSHADPWRVFEDFLLEREPAVGCASYDWHLIGGALEQTRDCQTLRYFDALLNAFHHEALTTLLPYYDLLDEASECYSQNLLCSLAAELYPGHVMQTNHVHVINTAARRDYSEFLLSKPEHLYLESLRDPERARRFQRQSVAGSARHPTMGPPLPKSGAYAVSESDLSRLYDLGHPFWVRRRELLELPATHDFFSEDADSGRARRWREVREAREHSWPPSAPPSPMLRLLRLTHPLRSRLGLVGSNPRMERSLRWARALPRLRMRIRARELWRRWWRTLGAVHQIPESRQLEVFELLALALNELSHEHVNFIDVGAGRGDVLKLLVHDSGLEKPVFSIGIDPVDVRGHRGYTGYVVGAIADGPEASAELFRYSSSDCSSLKRMDPTKVTHKPGEGGALRYYASVEVEGLEEVLSVPTFRLSTIVRQYGLAGEVLHFVKIDAQGSDLDVFLSLGPLVENVLFLQIESVYGENGEGGPPLYEGQTSFAEDRAAIEAAGFRLFNVARFGVTPEADVLFVNAKLFEEYLPDLAR